ncbi:hypothetical protein CWS43_26155 [Rahnella sp. AA]|nr:hypothetical protein CWS43_26155 [Rahnella sp. AA]
MSELIHAQPVPASSVRCLHYRPAALDVLSLPSLPRYTSGNVMCIGLTGSRKTFFAHAILDSIPPDQSPVIIYDEYWQHTEKWRVS